MNLTVPFLCLAIACSARASTLVFSSSPTGPAAFNAANVVKVANGSLIRAGMITDPANPAASFVEFGTGTVKNAGFGSNTVPGKINGSILESNDESTHGIFNSQKIYVWIYNAPTAAAATEQGLFQTSLSFPVNSPADADDYITIQSAAHITGVIPLPGYTSAQILPGDATDSLHFVLGSSIPVPPDSDADGMPDTWETANGLNPSNPADALFDPDGDGFDNRLEHALGSDPRSPSTPGHPVQGKVQAAGIDYATFQFTRLKGLTGSTLIPEVSSALNASGWQAALTTVSITSQGLTESVLLRDTLPLSNRQRLFFRVRLTVP